MHPLDGGDFPSRSSAIGFIAIGSTLVRTNVFKSLGIYNICWRNGNFVYKTALHIYAYVSFETIPKFILAFAPNLSLFISCYLWQGFIVLFFFFFFFLFFFLFL